MWKTISAIFAAAAIAGAVSLFQGSDVNASALAALTAKADRADLQQNCTRQGWPYYKTACLHDENLNAGRVLNVRLISTDRIPQADPNTDPDLAPHWPVMLSELLVAAPAWARGTK